MKQITDTKIQAKIKIEILKVESSEKFRNINLKWKTLHLLQHNRYLRKKLERYYIKSFLIKRKKLVQKRFIESLKVNISDAIKYQQHITLKLILRKKVKCELS